MREHGVYLVAGELLFPLPAPAGEVAGDGGRGLEAARQDPVHREQAQQPTVDEVGEGLPRLLTVEQGPGALTLGGEDGARSVAG